MRKCKIKAQLNTVIYLPEWINIDMAIPSVVRIFQGGGRVNLLSNQSQPIASDVLG